MIQCKYILISIYTIFLVFIFILSLNSEERLNIEDEVREISGLLMCPVCQGQSVSESNSQLAVDMRNSIRTQLIQGKSKEEIILYFKSRYGDSILASPPTRGINWLIWLLPTTGIIIIGLILGNYIYKSRNQGNSNEDSNNHIPDETIQKIENELDDLKM